MIYKDFKGAKLSSLGMGCMRLPTINGDNTKVDIDAVSKMVKYAMEKGVNYFDTAWGYHGGYSERALGQVLKDYPRDSFYLTSKFPGYDLNNMGKIKEIFEEQLKRCQVEYFDFYLFHNVCELNIDAYLNPEYEIMSFMLEEKKKGRIRHIGFSTHGTIETVKRFLSAYGEHMEFCQIQLNWLDWKMQNAKEKVELLREINMPIWVMEPVRGGKLASIDLEYETELKNARKDATTVEWAFRYIQSFKEVTVTLSGMSNMDQLKENIEIFSKNQPTSFTETEMLYNIARKMTERTSLPCTACRYCTDHCPMELDIPKIIELYNEHSYTGGGFLAPMAIGAMPDNKKPSACIGCGSCEAVCPQNIKISKMMSDFSAKLKK